MSSLEFPAAENRNRREIDSNLGRKRVWQEDLFCQTDKQARYEETTSRQLRFNCAAE